MSTPKLPDLSKVEWNLMNVIWRYKKATVSDVYAYFKERRGWSYTTVKTMMQRLVKKGYLESDASQRAHVYKPAVTRRSTVKKALSETLDRVLDDELAPLVAYASRRRNLSDEDIETLKKILERGETDDG